MAKTVTVDSSRWIPQRHSYVSDEYMESDETDKLRSQ